ncbi:hypothetical protein L596_020099 [Steinernema carpocapsae]|uniref:proline--tRNA ligase n=1 Tax=Steinernema carpocapsae TaxID=34508 RepID=A0A4U5MSI2_STECR|nr:hypothetical protein L596_020099 [Steinernema carpocapsae]
MMYQMQFASRFRIGSLDLAPVKTKSLSYQLMLSNNMIEAGSGRGIFNVLEIGQRVIDKLTKIIESDLNAVGARKRTISTLGAKELWEKTGRWDQMTAEMWRVTDRLGNEFCLQPTAEEAATKSVARMSPLRKSELPYMVYQTTNKFRDEMNPRFGLLRAREFLMNDLYTFDLDEAAAMKTYEEITKVYDRLFRTHLTLPDVYRVQADSGHVGGALSHEYHIPNECAEDKIAFCGSCKTSLKFEGDVRMDLSCQECSGKMEMLDTVEVGHTFLLGDKYSAPLGAKHTDKRPYYMGCFGLGVTRIVAACIDTLSISPTAMRLPRSIVPYEAAVILPKKFKNSDEQKTVNDFVNSLESHPLSHEILLDDRVDKSIGRRLAEMNKLGIPNIVVLGGGTTKSIRDGAPKFEFLKTKPRSDKTEEIGMLSHQEVLEELQK